MYRTKHVASQLWLGGGSVCSGFAAKDCRAVSLNTVINSQSPASPADDSGVIIMSDAAIASLFIFVIIFATIRAIQSSYSQSEREKDKEFLRNSRVAKRNEAIKEIITELFNTHKDTLLLKYDQLTYRDDYGQLVTDNFLKELEYFCETVIHYSLKERGIFYFNKETEIFSFNFLLDLIGEELELIQRPPDTQAYPEIQTGEEYERFIGTLIQPYGWDVKYTPKTGDQGIDIIASKNGTTVAIQCKYYSSPVGNSAIQEAYSGAKYYNAQNAMVITSSSLTKSAKQLASSLGVLYFHHGSIDKFFSDGPEKDQDSKDNVSDIAPATNPMRFFVSNPTMSGGNETIQDTCEYSIEYYENLINSKQDPFSYYSAAKIRANPASESFNEDVALLYFSKAYEGGLWFAAPYIAYHLLNTSDHIINDLKLMDINTIRQATTKYIIEYANFFKTIYDEKSELYGQEEDFSRIHESINKLLTDTFELMATNGIPNPLIHDKMFLAAVESYLDELQKILTLMATDENLFPKSSKDILSEEYETVSDHLSRLVD